MTKVSRVVLSAGIAVLAALLFLKYAGSARSTLEADSMHADACALETKRPRRGVLSLDISKLENGKFVTTLGLKSDNAFDSFWYVDFTDPPLKDHAGQRVFRVSQEPLKMEALESDKPGFRTGKQFRSYAYLTKEKLEAMDAGRPVTGRYPLAAGSVVSQVNGDNGKGGTHLTSEGTGQAVDLLADPGTEVLAFGAGSVVAVEDGYDDRLQCGDMHARTYSNLMAVLQDDGYEALYGHLEMGSSLVTEGMRVESGQPLAKVGHYSGHRKGAHLHFQLGGLTEGGLVSVPVAFDARERSSVIVPRVGQSINLQK